MYKFAICDADAICVNDLNNILEEFFSLINLKEYKIYVFKDGASLLKSKEQYDLILLEILLHDIDGIEIAQTFLEQGRKENIVFVSSSENGKTQGYRVKALRYITKPINKDELLFDLEELFDTIVQEDKFIYDEKIPDRKLFFKDIEYIEVLGRHTYVNIKGENRDFRKQLIEWETILEGMQFMKSHKSFLINLKMVSDVNKHYVTLKSGKKLALSRTYYASFKKAFFKYQKKINICI